MGLIVVLAIMGTTVLLMCTAYQRRTGDNFLESLFHDIFTKGLIL